jgi:hypothetical protein
MFFHTGQRPAEMRKSPIGLAVHREKGLLAALTWEVGEDATPWGFIARRLGLGGRGGATSVADRRDGAAAWL